MNSTSRHPFNFPLLLAVAFSILCWVGLYAVYADFGRSGLELMRSGALIRAAEGAILIALNTFGLMLIATFGIGAVAVLARLAHHDRRDDGSISGTRH